MNPNLPSHPKCKTCRHWSKWIHHLNPGWGCCDLFDGDSLTWFNPTAKAYAESPHNDGTAGLNTHQTFGCVQHEEKNL